MTENILPASYVEARITQTDKAMRCILHCNGRTILESIRKWPNADTNKAYSDVLVSALKKCPEFIRLFNDKTPDLSARDLSYFCGDLFNPSICLPSIYYAPPLFRCLGLYGRMVIAGNAYILHFQSLAEWISDLNEQAAYNDEPLLTFERNPE